MFVNSDMWVVHDSWFSMTKEDIGNLVNRANDSEVGRRVCAALGL